MTSHTDTQIPVVALTLGDPAGIGPELIAKLLAEADLTKANVVLVGDRWLWDQAKALTGLSIPTVEVASLSEVRDRGDTATPAFLAVDTIDPADVRTGQADAAGGASVLTVQNRCMDAAMAGDIDAIVRSLHGV